VIVAVNKVDCVPKPTVLPLLAQLSRLLPQRPLVPVSARQGTQVDVLLSEIVSTLPAGPPHFPADVYTTATERFLVQEMVREQVFLAMREEVPYGTAVVVESFVPDEGRGLTEIHATILVERDSHRGMVIGVQGTTLTEIGSRARLGIVELLGTRVHLALFVRVEPDWARRRDRLAELEL
jgi:GTP-binding protein Era